MAFPPKKITYKRPVLSLPVPNYTKTVPLDLKLTDDDFKHLLLHYSGLKFIEKEYLILLLQELNKTEPKRFEYLKQFFDVSLLFMFTPQPILKNKLRNESKEQRNPKKRQIADDIPNFKDTCAKIEKILKPDSSDSLLRLYAPILEAEAAEIIEPYRYETNENDSVCDSLLIRKDRLRKDIKHLFDWDKTTVPALAFRSLKNLIKNYDDLCLNEMDILLDYISKLKRESPKHYAMLYDYTKKDKVLSDDALNELEEFLNDSSNFEQINLESDEEYSLDDVIKTALNNIEKKKKQTKFTNPK